MDKFAAVWKLGRGGHGRILPQARAVSGAEGLACGLQANDCEHGGIGKATKEEKRRVKDLERELAPQRPHWRLQRCLFCEKRPVRSAWLTEADGHPRSPNRHALINEAIRWCAPEPRPAPRNQCQLAPSAALDRERRSGSVDQRPLVPRPEPATSSREAERAAVLEACNSVFCHQVRPKPLADQGLYLAIGRVSHSAGDWASITEAVPSLRCGADPPDQACAPVALTCT